MLILTRKLGESITIGSEVKVTILGIKGNNIRLGIVAPPELAVHREEIYRLIQEQNIASARNVRNVAAKVHSLGKLWQNMKEG